MRQESVSSAKNKLSALLREVRNGQVIYITDRGVPVAKLTPVGEMPGVTPQMIDLAQRGLLVLPKRSERLPELLRVPLPGPVDGPSVVEILLEERREGH
ncbi:MAG: type II toxin-antitoxin system prevent-host-death family antitoxin [Gemmatimonadales bacterium]|nr:type II toxin-antitoxin system prevent-host-death family antitoxin [Gemmatimonadales bacterium]